MPYPLLSSLILEGSHHDAASFFQVGRGPTRHEGVLKCRFEVSSFGGRYFVLCQELEHLNVTWVSERDVPEAVEMWSYRKLSSVHLPWLILFCSTLSIQSDM